MKRKILKVGVPTENNRIYSKEALEGTIKTVKHRTLIGVFGLEHPRIEDAAMFIEDLYIEDDDLVAEFQILKNDKGKILEGLLEKGEVELSPVGHGDVSEAGEVTNYTMTSIAITPCLEKEG